MRPARSSDHRLILREPPADSAPRRWLTKLPISGRFGNRRRLRSPHPSMAFALLLKGSTLAEIHFRYQSPQLGRSHTLTLLFTAPTGIEFVNYPPHSARTPAIQHSDCALLAGSRVAVERYV